MLPIRIRECPDGVSRRAAALDDLGIGIAANFFHDRVGRHGGDGLALEPRRLRPDRRPRDSLEQEGDDLVKLHRPHDRGRNH